MDLFCSAIYIFRVSFFVPILLSHKKVLKQSKVKDYFVLDSYFFNRWIGTYSGSESWGVLLHHFYQHKAPIIIPFMLCSMHIKILLNYLHNLYYESFVYLGVPNYPLFLVKRTPQIRVIYVITSKIPRYLFLLNPLQVLMTNHSILGYILYNAYVYFNLTLVHRKVRLNPFTAKYYAVFFTHITIWFSSSTRMMNKNIDSTHEISLLKIKYIRNRVNFMSQRITRRDIDNTHRVNGISYLIDWAAARKPPKKEYLLFDPQPDIRRPTGAILEMAIHKKTPILTSARTRRYPKGITKKLSRIDVTAMDGPILNKRVSPLDGRRFSLKSNFVPSAKAWRIPKGPAYSGPIRCCIPADISLSNQTITSTPIVIPNTGVKIGTSIHIISYTSFKDSNLKKELIACTSVVSIIILTINFSHNDIYATYYCHNISQFHSFNYLRKDLQIDKTRWSYFPSPRKNTLISYQKNPYFSFWGF
uniref:NADH-plastoquinone oxidoreductase subunit 4 n=1 Tax=Torilis scabra TaxID=79188 RepID=A0A650DR14_9APIA|nr:NADH-plastoquinone oxidoreductase subunit 4 [Torilis scabra]